MKRRILYGLWMAVCAGVWFWFRSETAAVFFLLSALYLAAAGLSLLPKARVWLRFRHPQQAETEETVRLEIEIENLSLLPLPAAELTLKTENQLTGEEQSRQFGFSLGSRGKYRQEVLFYSHTCGKVRVQTEQVMQRDLLGIFRRKAAPVSESLESEFFLLPRHRSTGIRPETLYAYDMNSYCYAQNQAGRDPAEIFDIRGYQPQDSPKQIHWKLSAKLGQTVIKESSHPIDSSLLVLFDNLLAPDEVLSPERKSRLLETAVSLSRELTKAALVHDFAWYRQEEKCVKRVHITCAEDLNRVLLELLSASFLHTPVPMEEQYRYDAGSARYALLFYVTAGENTENKRWENFSEVRVIRGE